MNASKSSPVNAMFGRIAGVYDFLNHALSLGIDRHWRKELTDIVQAPPEGIIVDLAAGTLDVALAIHKRHPHAIVPAIDFCSPMLKRGLRKIEKNRARNRIFPCAGDAFNLPLPDDCADCLTIAFGIRNINPREKAFLEIRRILKNGGKICILEFGSGQEKIWRGVYNFYLNKILPSLAGLVARDKGAYDYLATTINSFPAAGGLERELQEAGFVNTGYRKLNSGIVCLHWGEKSKCGSAEQ